MPSPFPGIDPYLEGQGLWPDFHHTFLVYCSEALSNQLPEHYYTQIEERVVPADIRETSRPIVFLEETVEIHVQIIRLPDRARVTVLELLTPENKREPGRSAYLAHRAAIERRPAHLVELDFVIEGERLPEAERLPPGEPYAIVGRTGNRRHVHTWMLRLSLPTIAVPLLLPVAEVLLDLSAVFATTYERGRYAKAIDYTAPLSIPLKPEDKAWAEGLAALAAR
jgi:hypothetical protein